MGKNKKIYTPNVYNQWLALFRKNLEEKKKHEREKNNHNKQKHKSKAVV